jgi:hypothetical protein
MMKNQPETQAKQGANITTYLESAYYINLSIYHNFEIIDV